MKGEDAKSFLERHQLMVKVRLLNETLYINTIFNQALAHIEQLLEEKNEIQS